MYLKTKQFPELSFCVTHSKPHGDRGLSKHDHLSFDTKLGNGACSIFHISCACVTCTTMLDKLWISGIPFKKT